MRLAFAALLLATGLWGAGCGPTEEIRTYQVTKPAPPTRMLGAMIPVDKGAWFFKVQGPHGVVSEHVDEFWSLIDSVRFDSDTGDPSWDTPEGWKRKPAQLGQMRYVTLEIGSDTFPLEVAVSSFDQMNMTDDEFRLANINRWRRLLSAKEVTVEELDTVIERRSLGDWEALCVDLSGEASRGGPPMAAGASPPPREPVRAAAKPRFEKPANWTDKPLKMFSVATFALPPVDGAAAEVTLSQVGGGLAANAGRWFGQANMSPPASPDELAGHFEPLEDVVGEAQLIVLSKDEEPDTKTLAIVALQNNGSDWYIKYTGTWKDWSQHRADFLSFVQSIEFSGEEQ